MKKLAYIQTYKTVVKELAIQFSKHYFDRSDVEVLWDENVGIWPIDCNQYVFSIDNVVCALHNDISRRILLDWYYKHMDYRRDAPYWKENLPYPTNLYNYWLQNKWLNEND